MVLETMIASLWWPLAISGVVTAGAWTFYDAKSRGAGRVSWLWGLAVAGFLPLVLGYLAIRERIGTRSAPMSPTQRTVGVWAVGAVFAVVLAPFLAPATAVTVGWYLLGLFPVGILLGYALIYGRGGRRHRSDGVA